AASANPFSSRPAGGRRNAIGENPGGCRFIPSLYRAEDTGRCPAGTAFGAISPFPRPSDLVRRHVACCGPPLGPRARDVGVAANVLLTVTSAPFEVDTCVRAPGAVYERRSGSPFSWPFLSRARLPPARRRPSCRTTTRTASSTTTSTGT